MTTKSAILCAELAAAVEKEPAKNRYKRMEAAWLAFAEEQDWLDGHVPPVPDHSHPPGRVSNYTVGKAISNGYWASILNRSRQMAFKPQDNHRANPDGDRPQSCSRNGRTRAGMGPIFGEMKKRLR